MTSNHPWYPKHPKREMRDIALSEPSRVQSMILFYEFVKDMGTHEH